MRRAFSRYKSGQNASRDRVVVADLDVFPRCPIQIRSISPTAVALFSCCATAAAELFIVDFEDGTQCILKPARELRLIQVQVVEAIFPQCNRIEDVRKAGGAPRNATGSPVNHAEVTLVLEYNLLELEALQQIRLFLDLAEQQPVVHKIIAALLNNPGSLGVGFCIDTAKCALFIHDHSFYDTQFRESSSAPDDASDLSWNYYIDSRALPQIQDPLHPHSLRHLDCIRSTCACGSQILVSATPRGYQQEDSPLLPFASPLGSMRSAARLVSSLPACLRECRIALPKGERRDSLPSKPERVHSGSEFSTPTSPSSLSLGLNLVLLPRPWGENTSTSFPRSARAPSPISAPNDGVLSARHGIRSPTAPSAAAARPSPQLRLLAPRYTLILNEQAASKSPTHPLLPEKLQRVDAALHVDDDTQIKANGTLKALRIGFVHIR
ncbi:hypothetical protein B0H17DRAFT_1145711 [Mycena rosella]|uniref:Uncharacterized protein n=1 Tax=Mycena rosella TaxID=1033263 RepID=A0AAD7G481_MYCRO|nr:hypothetical protein B0H17DRAFT_1145711 [Mycena rosella]